MPETKHQLLRMIRLVADLKKNKYPTAATFAKKLGDDIRDPITCSARTIERDIAFLREELSAPIEYDPDRKGYFLGDKEWNFEYSNLSEEMMASTLLGVRLVEDIMPEPVRGEICDAVDQHLRTNHSTKLDNAFLDSLLFTSGVKATIPKETFKEVFDGWRLRQSIEFVYRTPNHDPSIRHFEPHVVAFQDGLWYTRGIALPGGKVTVFAIHRMSEVRLTGKTFEIDKTILEDVRKNGLFVFDRRSDIKLHCDASIAYYLRELKTAEADMKVDPQPDGSVIVTLPAMTEQETLRWVLGEAGNIRILEPGSLRERLVEAARKIIERNS